MQLCLMDYYFAFYNQIPKENVVCTAVMLNTLFLLSS